MLWLTVSNAALRSWSSKNVTLCRSMFEIITSKSLNKGWNRTAIVVRYETCSVWLLTTIIAWYLSSILVPRGRAPFGQHQKSQPPAVSNNGSPRFTDFPSLCACFESSLTNLIGSGLNLLCLQIHSKPDEPGQRSRFLVLTKRSAASGDENVSAETF